MGVTKDFLITVHGGGDEAVAAVQRVSEDWRMQLEQAAAEIESATYMLHADRHSEHEYPVDGWRWFENKDEAREHFKWTGGSP